MFEPRLALASLSGASDANWAIAGAEFAGAAFLGGIAVCPRTRTAAEQLIERDREEFLPTDPLDFIDSQLRALDGVDIQPGFNVRSVETGPIETVATVCAKHDAIYEVNAHCRQDEICAVGAGEALLADTDRLVTHVQTARDAGAVVSVKVRAEVGNVDLAETASRIADAGADIIHVDTMDSEPVIGEIVAAADLFVIANNGVRDRSTISEYFDYGADAVSVGRPSDQPAVLERIFRALEAVGAPKRGDAVSPMRNDR